MLVFHIASLPDVYHSTSGDVILMTLVGGVGTIIGPIVGAFIVVGMQHYLAPLGTWVNVVQGVVFVALRAVLPPGHCRSGDPSDGAAAMSGATSFSRPAV